MDNFQMIFRATDNADYYVEVLEWSDWDEGTSADGGSGWEDQLGVIGREDLFEHPQQASIVSNEIVDPLTKFDWITESALASQSTK